MATKLILPTPLFGTIPSRVRNVYALSQQCSRRIHQRPPRSVPSPTPFIPDVSTFLSVIGRDMSKFASKFNSWEDLFMASSTELRNLGIEPARQRRYLLRKREKFRLGDYGPGGDLDCVVDGVAQLRVVEVPITTGGVRKRVTSAVSFPSSSGSATLTPGMKRVIVNLPPDATTYTYDPSNPLKKYAQMKISNGSKIRGPFLAPLKGTKGSAALIKATDGMWEDKRGQKVDGGERRRAEVRAKKRIEARRKGST